MTPGLTRDLGAFAARTRFDDLPDAVVQTARSGFFDCAGAIVAGRRSDVTRALLAVEDPPAGEASVLLGDRRAPAPAAALVGAAAAHSLELDDIALLGHPSTVLVPALLAEGEQLDAMGRDLLAAWSVGYEVWADLIARDAGMHNAKGWHVTPVFGVVAVAAACASLRRLTPERAAAALGIAASLASGLMASTGSMAKYVHTGRAAQGGLLAARYAEAGVTAAADALEAPYGFLRAFSPAGEVDVDAPTRAGERWRAAETGLSLRRSPLCYSTSRLLDAAARIRREHGVDPGAIRRVVARVNETEARVLRVHDPHDAGEARFSAEFALAAMLLEGSVGLEQVQDAVVRRDDVRALMAKVRVEVDPPDAVRVELDDGRVLESGPVERARGAAGDPFDEDEVVAKFEDCLAYGADDEREAARLRTVGEALRSLETVDSVRTLLRGPLG